MPEPVEAPERDKRWAERIQRFHRTGKALGGPPPSLGVWPAALECLRVQLGESALHPFVLAPHDGPDQPVVAQGVRTLLSAAIDGLEVAGAKPQHLSENWRRLASIAGRLMSSRSQACDLAELLADAGERLIEELGVSSQTRAALEHDLEALRGVLPTNAAVHDLRPDTALRLYLEVDAAVRAPWNARFRKEMEALSERVADQLTLDRLGSRAGRDPDALAASFGDAGSARVDMKALASTLPQLRGSAPLEPERRARLEQARDAIERYLERDAGLPRVLLLRPAELELPVSGCESWTHPDPLAAAVGVFEGVAATEAELFRAVRLARLELAGEYRPGRHDEALAELSWEGFSSEELALLPAVVVLTTGRRLRGCDRGSLSELLSSSRPVRVLVQDEVAAADEAQDLSRFHVDLGALVISHREAFAVGSSLARPERLVAGMTRMVLAPRPAVALVQLPALDPPAWRSLRLEAALQGRASPDFSYDPDAGSSWAERFDLEANPQPDRPWPLLSVTHLDGGAERTMDVALTFADAMAAEPAYMRHLWTIPSEAWDDLQLPLDDYLDKLTPGEPERWIPYLWVLAPDGTLQRAVATRALAMACRDRLRAWRVIQELGGHSNVYAERAAARARQEVIQDTDARRVELEQSHALELDRVGREAARDSMERLAAVLLDPEGFAGADAPVVPPLAPAPPQPGSEALEAVAPPAEQALVAEEEEDDEALSFDEPYIDTPLCTSCNDCTDLNPRLFSYNADKQAFIADSSAGSFAELVKAAELCPADCIHPGKPRSDDPTATPDLIERAARYN
jgi:ferredoxin